MSIEDRVTGFSAFVEHVFFVGFSAVAFLALLVVVTLLVRFLLVATKAAEIYVRTNGSATSVSSSPRTTQGAPNHAPKHSGSPGVPPARAAGASTADATPTAVFPVDPDRA